MLAAVGATQKHLRFVLLTNGALVGAIAALVGTLLGFALWFVVAPMLESAVGHRIDRLNLPWLLISMVLVVALLGAIAAAWWPGRTVARLPVVLALSGRPPKPRPARHAAIAAGVLIAVGIGCLALSDRDRPPLIVAGIVTTILGTLLLGPPAIRLFSGVAGLLSVAPRLALRDLVRYQARSGAALAAVTLALGIAATIVVVASAEEAKAAAQPPNLSDRQIRVYIGPQQAPELVPVDVPAQLTALRARVGQLAARLGGAAVVPVRKAYQPGAVGPVVEGTSVFPTIDLTRKEGRQSYKVAGQLYVATPAMLTYLGIDPASVEPTTDFLADPSVQAEQFVIPSFKSRREFAVTNVQRVDTGQRLLGNPWGDWAAGAKPMFITLDGLRRRGWKHIPSGWLVESNRPLTSEQIADARELAAAAGLTIEIRREGASQAKLIVIATAAGGLLALGILALTVGLIRGESAGDVRTLTATGASSAVRRTLTAATAGALALLGSLLAVAGSYAVLTALYHDDLGYLSDVPVLYLALAVVGVPMVAAAAGWLVAGREPPAIARSAIE
jgi:putative ABC transport system permease protein